MPFYGEWETVKDEIDPLTQERQVFLGLFEQDGRDYFMGIACYENAVQLTVSWNNTIKDPTVNFRIGDQPIKTEVWNISYNGEATNVAGERAIAMINDLFNADEFVIQAAPENLAPVTAVFRPAGVYWAVKPVLEACEVELD